MIDFSPDLEEDSSTCVGIIFEASISHYMTKRGLFKKQSLLIQKRKSCSGCSQCGWILDDITESGIETLIGFDDIKHDKYYTPRVINVSRDWETGQVDDYDIEIVEVKS